jgi:dihydroorotase
MDVTLEGNAYINGTFEDCCIGVTEGKISCIKKNLRGDTHFNFRHKLILPAGIDIHVHFREPGLAHKEDFSTGTMAAAYGGISCVFDMPNTVPQTTTPQAASDKITTAGKKAYVDFGVYAGITDNNIGTIANLSNTCSGFKIYLGTSTNSLQFDANNLKEVFRRISLTNKLVLLHAEDNQCLIKHTKKANNLVDHRQCRPATCEATAIRAILEANGDAKTRIHICHLSSSMGLEVLQDKPATISCGVTPHHLLFTAEDNLRPQTHFKVNPPLRTRADQKGLFKAVKNGFIDILESDHAPHTLEEKEQDFSAAPSGLPGVETMFPLFLYMAKKERLPFQTLLSALCEKPAALLNVPKGKIAVGCDADFIVLDLKNECNITSDRLHSKCGWTPFEGHTAIFPEYLFVRGEKLIEDYELQGWQGFGRYVGG